MKLKRLIAGVLMSVVVLEQVVPAMSVYAEEEVKESSFNREGVWLTEIYQNDVDRSVKNDKRQSNGYEDILTYASTTDLMEFIEITSTYDKPVKLNELYEIYYNDSPVSVSDMNGNSDITISKGQSVVIWNYRSDVTTVIPTEEEFRKAMRVPDSAVVLKADSKGVNWATSAEFSIKEKKSGKIISTFNAVNGTHTQDGFSVELKIPDIGSEMEVYRKMTIPSAGYVYSNQLNGLVEAKKYDGEYIKGVYLTEIRPNDISRSAQYGIQDDLMECFEIVNTTDKTVDLNTEYELSYVVKEGSRKKLPLHHWEDINMGTSSAQECTIAAGESAVIWCYRKDYLSGYTEFPTEQDFRKAYDIPDSVPVYVFTVQNGMNNTYRGIEIYKLEENGEKALVSYYSYIGNDDCKDNKSAELAVNPEGPEMLLYTENAATSMGNVKAEQVKYLKDDGSSIELSLKDAVPKTIKQGEEIRVNFFYDVTGELPRTQIKTFYRFDGSGSWYSNTELKRRVPNLYEALIPADELFSHDYVEFYVSADNYYRSTLSDIYTVKIDKIKDCGIRTNISENEELSGIVSITANGGTDNITSKIYVDDVEYQTQPMMEDGAYFTFHADGRDSYFKNAIMTKDNELIAAIGKWQYTILDGQAVHIDNRYFEYNPQTDAYEVTLRFWAGTYGATVNDYLMPEANREDFTVTQLALRLSNGNVYYPVSIGPDAAETSAKTNLSTDYNAIHSIGDSKGWCPYMDVTYQVPSSEVSAVGAELDTTKLSEGRHTLKIVNGESEKTVSFIADNTAPLVLTGIESGNQLSGNININPQVKEDNTLSKYVVTLDENEIETPYETTAYQIGKGEHTLTVFAEDLAGNQTIETVDFTVKDVELTLNEAGTTEITDSSAKLYLSVQNTTDAKAEFYSAEKISASNIETYTGDGILPYIRYTIKVGDVSEDDTVLVKWNGEADNSDDTHVTTMYVENIADGTWDKVALADENGCINDGIFAAKNHVKAGEANIIVQCSADSALPDLNSKTDGNNDNGVVWNGDSMPENYDFAFAWETDTQYYAEEWMQHYLNMNNWIVDNAEEKKIKYVIHTGDIVDDYDMVYEWENADKAMRILDDAGISYGVLGGNHDVAAGLADYENYYKYFGEDRFASQQTYGGSYKNNSGHYDLISEGGQDFIIIYMSWNIYDEEIKWMNDILQKYSNRKAILCFHTYTNVKYSGNTLLDYFGELVQKEVVEKNPNVFAVLNGHYHGSSYETVMFDDDNDGIKERTVYQICTDYQSGFEGGSGYIKMLYFDLDNNKIYMNSYSPSLDDFNFYDDYEVTNINKDGSSAVAIDKMILDVYFDTNEKNILEKGFSAYLCTKNTLGTAEINNETGRAEVNLEGLSENKEYAWYAAVLDKDSGYLKTDVYEFTTNKKSAAEGGELQKPENKPNGDVEGDVEAPKTGDTANTSVLLTGMFIGAYVIFESERRKRIALKVRRSRR